MVKNRKVGTKVPRVKAYKPKTLSVDAAIKIQTVVSHLGFTSQTRLGPDEVTKIVRYALERDEWHILSRETLEYVLVFLLCGWKPTDKTVAEGIPRDLKDPDFFGRGSLYDDNEEPTEEGNQARKDFIETCKAAKRTVAESIRLLKVYDKLNKEP